MTRFRRAHFYGLFGLLVLVVSAGGSMMLATGTHAGAAPDSKGQDSPLLRIVCFGHADVEDGIASLYPVMPGRVQAVPARENTEVKAGTELVRLDDGMAQLRVREAEADLEAAREQLTQSAKLREQHKLKVAQQKAAMEAVHQRLTGAREIRDRKRELERDMHVSARDVRTAEALVRELEAVQEAESKKLEELNLNDPGAGIRRAQAEVDAKESRLEQARRGVKECVLVAPSDGTVLRVLVRGGEVLGPQPKQPAVLFCPKGPRIVRAEVEQEYASRVAVGQVASLQDDTTSAATWRGKVVRVSDWYTHRRSVLQEPFQFNDVRTLECIIALDPNQPTVRIGQRLRIMLNQGP